MERGDCCPRKSVCSGSKRGSVEGRGLQTPYFGFGGFWISCLVQQKKKRRSESSLFLSVQ